MNKTYIALLLGLLTLPAQAQQDTTLTRTVVVENQYNPSLMDANKINILPSVEEPKVNKKEIEYARTERPMTSFSATTLPRLGELPSQEEASKGFIKLGYGNRGLLLGRLHYQQEVDAQNEWSIGATFDGFNGKVQPENGNSQWTSRSYQSELFGGYRHRFDRNVLGVDLGLGVHEFNYLPTIDTPSDKQGYTTGRLGVSLSSLIPTDRWQYKAEAEYDYFSLGHNYQGGKDQTAGEHTLQLEGDASYRLSSNQQVGLGLELAWRKYSEPLKGYVEGEGLYEELFNTFHLGLNPYYQFMTDELRIRLGAHVDIVSALESAVKFAPDVLVEFPFDNRYNLYAQLKGGVITNDFRRMKEITPYGVDLIATEETYTPVDLTVGFRAGVAPGVSLHFYAGYALNNDDLLVDTVLTAPTPFVQGKSNEVKGGASIRYDYKEWLHLSVGGDYHAWSGQSDHKELLYTKPALDLNLHADGKVKKFGWELDYHYTSRYKGEMNAINDLALGLRYDLPEHFQIWAKGDNLLNRSYSYYWGYPSLKINFLVGAAYRF